MLFGPIAAVILAAQPSQAPAPPPVSIAPDVRWSMVGTQSGVTVFIDENSLEATGDRRRMRLRMVGEMQPDGARSAIGIVEIDCRSRTGRPVEIRFFDARGALLETRFHNGAAVPTRSGSVDEQVQERACGRGSAAPVT
jgi:hypothetical protein